MPHPIARISLTALQHNLGLLRKASSHGRVMAMVKANAYGHGIVEVSRALQGMHIDALGVATTGEALELRRAGITARIALIYPPFPEEIDDLLRHQIEITIDSLSLAEHIEHIAASVGKKASIHIFLNTGMHHNGASESETIQIAEMISHSRSLSLLGLSTHFACADTSEKEKTLSQIALYDRVIKNLEQKNIFPQEKHLANSGGILRYPSSHGTIVRAGIALYGYPPESEISHQFQRVLSLSASVLSVRNVSAGESVGYGATWTATNDTRIATIAIGYADGLSRLLSNRGHVILAGEKCPIVGRVCMDAIMVDISTLDIRVGDEAIIIGGVGENRIDAEMIAEMTGTISYEVLTSLGARIERRFDA